MVTQTSSRSRDASPPKFSAKPASGGIGSPPRPIPVKPKSPSHNGRAGYLSNEANSASKRLHRSITREETELNAFLGETSATVKLGNSSLVELTESDRDSDARNSNGSGVVAPDQLVTSNGANEKVDKKKKKKKKKSKQKPTFAENGNRTESPNDTDEGYFGAEDGPIITQSTLKSTASASSLPPLRPGRSSRSPSASSTSSVSPREGIRKGGNINSSPSSLNMHSPGRDRSDSQSGLYRRIKSLQNLADEMGENTPNGQSNHNHSHHHSHNHGHHHAHHHQNAPGHHHLHHHGESAANGSHTHHSQHEEVPASGLRRRVASKNNLEALSFESDTELTSRNREQRTPSPHTVPLQNVHMCEHRIIRTPDQRTKQKEKLGFSWYRLLRLMFGKVFLPDERRDDLEKCSKEGTVVYVGYSTSVLLHLALWFVFSASRLPCPRYAQGLNWTGAPITSIWYSLGQWVIAIGMALLDAVSFGLIGQAYYQQQKETEIVKAMVESHSGAALLFLHHPRTLLSSWRSGRHQKRVKEGQPTSSGMFSSQTERPADGILVALVKLQRSQKKSIFLCPNTIVWDRSPMDAMPSWVDVLLGRVDRPGFMRELYLVFKDRRSIPIIGGRTLDLKEFIANRSEMSDEMIAKEARRLLTDQIQRERQTVTGPPQLSPQQLKQAILRSPGVKRAMNEVATNEYIPVHEVEWRAAKLVDGIADRLSFRVMGYINILLQRLFNQIFDGIIVDSSGLKRVRDAALKTPIVYIPTHKSHIDYLVLSYALYHHGISLPHVAAGDNLNIPVVGWILRRCGAFFLRRTFGNDSLYKAVFSAYFSVMLKQGYSTEFFIEGGRSRTGKVLPPKMGLMSYVIDTLLEDNSVRDVTLVPVAIDYDRVMEGSAYSRELLGERKRKETLGGLFAATRRLLGLNFGHVVVRFSHPIHLAEYVATHVAREKKLRHGQYAPVTVGDDRRHLTRAVAHRVVYDMNQVTVAMVTDLVATTLLTHHSRAMPLKEVSEKVLWLRGMIEERGRKVTPWDVHDTDEVVEQSIHHMKNLLKFPKHMIEPIVRPRESRRLEMSFYRNKILHVFIGEAIIAVAFHRSMRQRWKDRSNGNHSHSELPRSWSNGAFLMDERVPTRELLNHVRLLSRLLKREFVYRPVGIAENFKSTLNNLVSRGIFTIHNNSSVSLATTPHAPETYSFLCHLIWPFVDSYWVAALSLLPLLPDNSVEEKSLLKRMHMIAETLYHEDRLHYGESVSMETLANALKVFDDLQVVECSVAGKAVGGTKTATMVKVTDTFSDEGDLRQWIEDISGYRNSPMKTLVDGSTSPFHMMVQ